MASESINSKTDRHAKPMNLPLATLEYDLKCVDTKCINLTFIFLITTAPFPREIIDNKIGNIGKGQDIIALGQRQKMTLFIMKYA